MTSLGDVVDLLHEWYPPRAAEPWDAVGLVWGDRDAPCRRVAFAVDPALPVADEAVAWRADLLVVHHPLFLKGVHGFTAETAKGRTLGRLVGGGCGLLTAHTNADGARGGVSESLATTLGLRDLRPLLPAPGRPLDKIVVFAPASHAEAIRVALGEAGAGELGDYDSCTFTATGTGRFRPRAGASPTIGAVGELESVEEERIEAVLPRGRRTSVVRALLAAHPYEEPAWDLYEVADAGLATTGTGRVGEIAPVTLRDFAAAASAALPGPAGAVRVGGDLDRVVRRVAVLGGAGDSLLDAIATSDADVYLTSDLRHHPAAEFLEKDGPALVDVPHWAAEWTWLPVVAERLRTSLGTTPGATVETHVSEIVTDPWQLRV